MGKELSVVTRVDHPKYGEGIISKSTPLSYKAIIKEVEKLIQYTLDKFNGIEHRVDLGDKWKGGTMLLQPANRDLKPKEIPIETFFHKIVMMRDRLVY